MLAGEQVKTSPENRDRHPVMCTRYTINNESASDTREHIEQNNNDNKLQ